MPAEDPQAGSIHDWLLRYIKQLTMPESLEWIASQMKADGADGHSYTKDKAQMARIRQAWGEQMKLARQQAQREAAVESDGR